MKESDKMFRRGIYLPDSAEVLVEDDDVMIVRRYLEDVPPGLASLLFGGRISADWLTGYTFLPASIVPLSWDSYEKPTMAMAEDIDLPRGEFTFYARAGDRYILGVDTQGDGRWDTSREDAQRLAEIMHEVKDAIMNRFGQ